MAKGECPRGMIKNNKKRYEFVCNKMLDAVALKLELDRCLSEVRDNLYCSEYQNEKSYYLKDHMRRDIFSLVLTTFKRHFHNMI